MKLNLYLKIVLVICFFLLIVPNQIYGQGKVEDKEIVLQKDKKIVLPVANKNYEKIIPPKPKKGSFRPTYTLKEPFLRTKYSVVHPKPIVNNTTEEQVEEEEKQTLGAFIRAGGGNYATSLAEIFFEHNPNETFIYGLNLTHLNSRTGPIEKEKSSANRNSFNGFFKYFLPEASVNANFTYQQTENSLYGFDDIKERVFENDEQKQRFRRLGFDLSYQNLAVDNDLQYEASAVFRNISSNFKVRETQFSLLGKSTYQLNDNSSVEGTADITLWSRNDQEKQGRTFLSVQPAYRWNYNSRLILNLGINITGTNDTVNGVNKLNLYPLLKVSYSITDVFSIEAGVDGKMHKVSINQLSQKNPWIGLGNPLANSNESYRLFTSLTGEIKPTLTFIVKASYSKYKNLFFFKNNKMDLARFSLVYDTQTNLTSIGGQITYLPNENFRLQLQTDFYKYDLGVLEKPWMKPATETHLLTTYRPIQKLSLGMNAFILTGLEAYDLKNKQSLTLDNIFDVSLQADYLIFRKLSAFLLVNNLFSAKYQRYLSYPNQGINFIIGLTYGL